MRAAAAALAVAATAKINVHVVPHSHDDVGWLKTVDRFVIYEVVTRRKRASNIHNKLGHANNMLDTSSRLQHRLNPFYSLLAEYYLGQNQSIYHAGVQYIISSVVNSLLENPERKFVYIEQAFFQRWYAEQNSGRQAVGRRRGCPK